MLNIVISKMNKSWAIKTMADKCKKFKLVFKLHTLFPLVLSYSLLSSLNILII